MPDKSFIDSNIFLYAFSDKDPRKQHAAALIIKEKASVSAQVINEVSRNMLKKLGLDDSDVMAFIESCYRRYTVVSLDRLVFLRAASMRQNVELSYYDSLIVAAALEGGCRFLYSEDMHHGQVIESVEIVNPFYVMKEGEQWS